MSSSLIACRIKIYQPFAGSLKRQRCGSDVATSSLLHKSCFDMRCQSLSVGRSVSLACRNDRRENAVFYEIEYPDHYRSYVTSALSFNNMTKQSSNYQPMQQKEPSPSQHVSFAINPKFHRHRRKQPRHANKQNTNNDYNTQRTLHGISRRLSFFFSDANLRHDAYARSILEKYQNKYLPLDVIMTFKSIQKWTDDPNVVLDTVDYMNSDDNDYNNKEKLEIHTTRSGNVLIGRIEPFNYNTSIKEAQHKILTVEGWPEDQNTQRIEERVRSLLCAKKTSNANDESIKNPREKNPIAYWGIDIGKGIITIEFQTDEGAADAWKNLEMVAGENFTSTSPYQLSVKAIDISRQQGTMREELDHHKQYQLQIENLSLVARSFAYVPDIDLSNDERYQILSLFEQKHSKSEQIDQKPHVSNQTTSIDLVTNVPQLPAEEKWWANGRATPSLQKCVEAMDQIFQKHKNLPPPSREWLHEYARVRKRKRHDIEDDSIQKQLYEQRQMNCNDAVNLVSCIKFSIAKGKIRGMGGKDAYMLSELLGRAMMIFSETPPPRGTRSSGRGGPQLMPNDDGETSSLSAYEACLDVLGILQSLNLDILSSHYACAIRAACHEARWEEASKMFLNQINGNDDSNVSDDMITGGFSPINPSLGWDRPLEMGLYAVARDAWYKSTMSPQLEGEYNASPSKQVFDAAMKMCMISPSEQDSYVLAAGSALGRAGLWSECLDLATEPKSIYTYGPSITAAAMLACIKSSRSTEAIDAFDYFMSGHQTVASEWQWSGGDITAVEPLCRDLALTAMGNVFRGGYSQKAKRMFGVIMDDRSPLSCDGLLGLMQSLENDGAWEEAAQLLDRFVYSNFNAEQTKWRIVPNVLQLQKEGISDDALASDTEVNVLLGKMLASAMRVCNYHGQFGLAAVLCAIANNASDKSGGSVDWTTNSYEEIVLGDIIQSSCLRSDAVFEAYIHSLYGLGCKRIADRLINERENIDVDSIASMLKKRIKKNLPKAESWIVASKSIHRLLHAKDNVQTEPSDMCPESYFLFERGLSRAMGFCNDSNQPTAALFLFHHAARTLQSKKNHHLTNRFKSFLGMGNLADQNPREEIFTSDDEIDFKGIELTDSILAAIINAYTKMGQPDKARSTFNNAINQLENPHLMSQSLNSIMESLLEIDLEECMSFVDSMDDKCLTPTTFITLAKFFADNGVWHEIGEIYNMARRVGCVSEELGFITMQAVNESELLKGKIVVCRKIAEDVANTIGIDKDDWITSRYWEIKRYVGFHHARLLMNWNDPSLSQKNELLFAINEMRSCSSQGILTKNAPLLCIAQQGDLYSFDRHNASGKNSLSERQRRSVVNLILEACVEANRSSLLQKHTFTGHVVRSLRKVKANKECIKIVRGLVANVGRCNHQVAMEEAIYAATEERDYDSLDIIINKFEESGYDSSRLLV